MRHRVEPGRAVLALGAITLLLAVLALAFPHDTTPDTPDEGDALDRIRRAEGL